MKHLKSYENTTKDNEYWLIPTNNKGTAALQKIKCDKYYLLNFGKDRNDKYIYVAKNKSKIITNQNINWDWGWMPYTQESEKWFKEHNYNYNGPINITEVELLANKYNL